MPAPDLLPRTERNIEVSFVYRWEPTENASYPAQLKPFILHGDLFDTYAPGRWWDKPGDMIKEMLSVYGLAEDGVFRIYFRFDKTALVDAQLASTWQRQLIYGVQYICDYLMLRWYSKTDQQSTFSKPQVRSFDEIYEAVFESHLHPYDAETESESFANLRVRPIMGWPWEPVLFAPPSNANKVIIELRTVSNTTLLHSLLRHTLNFLLDPFAPMKLNDESVDGYEDVGQPYFVDRIAKADTFAETLMELGEILSFVFEVHHPLLVPLVAWHTRFDMPATRVNLIKAQTGLYEELVVKVFDDDLVTASEKVILTDARRRWLDTTQIWKFF